MKANFLKLAVLGSLACLCVQFTPGLKAADLEERIHTATAVLAQKQHSSDPIPNDLLAQAKGVAIFDLTKAGIGIGGVGGEGIVVTRRATTLSHFWTAPVAFNIGGGSVGAQLGFTQAKYIVVLNTDDAVQRFLGHGKLEWNATATGTAGSTSATERVTTDELSHREVVIYKEDSEGVFGGATLGGATIKRKNEINRDAYGSGYRQEDLLNGKVKAPKSADRLYQLLDGKA
ncbi:Lipid-binding SYLF domain-containing protein [Verrucomicrobium sp. GAS474]|uniref:lipid-binding SYLF domain-containing protein n=1 Tax=Verrucomicrobium sp. GAS474 TaxID=1882831 RepID=UPI00087D012C|nr:lipid-binding SYLF domain-containing protein [Verrucomicrobium sp. GAS474]SDT91356.1 Lipid-binding SYLF domain-containing protein [Verrucomicrobium sp. GAS474]